MLVSPSGALVPFLAWVWDLSMHEKREGVLHSPGKACIFPCTVTSRSLQGQESHQSSHKGSQNSPVPKQVWFPEASTSPSFRDPVSRVSGMRMGLRHRQPRWVPVLWRLMSREELPARAVPLRAFDVQRDKERKDLQQWLGLGEENQRELTWLWHTGNPTGEMHLDLLLTHF